MTERKRALAPDARRNRSAPMSGLWFVISLFCLQSTLFLMFAVGRLNLTEYVSFHLGLCAMTATSGRWWMRISSAGEDADDRISTAVQLAAWTMLGGPFGTLIAASMFVPRDAAANAGEATAEATIASGRPAELTRLELLHGSLLDQRLRLEHTHPIRPLLDIFIEGTQVEKFDALSLISRRYVPALAPALKRALEDGDAAVRVLAATVMAQQHNARTERIGTLQAIASEAPDVSKHWVELARAHFDYAESGLLEASRADAEVKQATIQLDRAEDLIAAAARGGSDAPGAGPAQRQVANHPI